MIPRKLRNLMMITAVLVTVAPALLSGPVMAAGHMPPSTVEKVLQRGVLKVGMSTFVPWAMKDKTGKLIGFEIDVARRLAKDMGVKVKFVPTKCRGSYPR